MWKQVYNKNLQITLQELKECLLDDYVKSYIWLPIEDMWAAMLTKGMILPDELEMALRRNVIELTNSVQTGRICDA